jgi:hypothetical protein
LQPSTPEVVKSKGFQASTPVGNSVAKNKENKLQQSEDYSSKRHTQVLKIESSHNLHSDTSIIRLESNMTPES